MIKPTPYLLAAKKSGVPSTIDEEPRISSGAMCDLARWGVIMFVPAVQVAFSRVGVLTKASLDGV
jgi:hypothetical protein